MTNNNHTVNINVSDNGSVQKTVKSVEGLKSALDSTASAASSVGKKLAAANARGSSDPVKDKNYGTQRGVVGTGASARDFAKESQGLGGLVRLYATVAANTFAAAAAFTALSKAMDTTNLVRGLDQLGAASGTNLGTLAKRVAEASDGAVSLRDSLEAVSKASTAGMSSTQILRMSTVAKQAAQALGRDMPDALSRITRGVAKLEPELLDELGIFIKIDDANQKYARSLGKTVSQLTDFEKRQGFANEVLRQAEEKFGGLKLDANPYSKLLATFQNLTQSTLELVNKGLGPVVKLLSESPTALAGILALIGKTLLSQALPAFGQYKKGLEEQVALTKQRLEVAQQERKAHRESIDSREAERIANRDTIASDRAAIEVAKLRAVSRAKLANLPSPTDVLAESPDRSALQASIKELEKRKRDLEKTAAEKEASGGYASASAAKRNADELAQIKATTAALNEKLKASKELAEIHGVTVTNGAPGFFSKQAADQRRLEAASVKAQRAEIVQAASKTYDSSGFADAWRQLRKDTAAAGVEANSAGTKMGFFNKSLTMVRGTAALTSGVLNTLGSAVGVLAGWVGAAVVVFEAFNFLFSKNEKEATIAANAIENLNSSTVSLGKTLDTISRKNPLAQISAESITAKATAFNELSDNLEKAFEAVRDQINTASWFDDLTNALKKPFNADIATKAAKEYSLAISKGLQSISGTAAGDTAINDISSLIGADARSYEAINTALKKTPELQQVIIDKMKAAGVEVSNVASKSTEMEEAFKAAGKTLDTILISAIPTDPIAKLGSELMTASIKWGEALKDPVNELNKLNELATQISKIRLLSPESQQALMAGAKEISKISTEIIGLSNTISTLATKEANIKAEYAKKEANVASYGDTNDKASINRRVSGVRAEASKALADVQLSIDDAKRLKASEEAKLATSKEVQNRAQLDLFLKGAKLVEDSIGQGFTKAGLTIRTAWAAYLSDTAAGIIEKGKIAEANVDLSIKELKATENLISSQEGLRVVNELMLVEQKRANLLAEKNTLSKQEFATKSQALSDQESALQNSRKVSGTKRTLKDINADINSGDAAKSAAATAELPAAMQKEALAAKLAEKDVEKKSIRLGTQLQLMEKASKLETDSRTNQININNEKLKQLDIASKYQEYLTEEQLAQKRTLTLDNIEKANANERAGLETQIAEARKAVGSSVDRQDKDKGVIELTGRLESLRKVQRERGMGDIKNLTDFEISERKRAFDFRMSLEKLAFDTTIAKESSLTTIKEDNLNTASNLGTSSGPSLVAAQGTVAIEKDILKTKQDQFNLNQQATSAIRAQKDILDKTTDEEGKKQVQEKYDALVLYYAAQIDGEKAVAAARATNIATIVEYNTLIAKQAEVTTNVQSIVDSLSSVFNKLGESIGGALKSMVDFTQAQDLYKFKSDKLAKDREKADSIVNPAEKAAALADITEKQNQLDKKNAKDQVAGIAQIAGASKKMFAEKTFAYKALNKVEQAAHIASMAMRATEMAATLAALPGKIANGVATIFDFSGPFGFVPAAAFLALMASLGAKGGGSSAAPPKGFTAEERQKVQGTGQAYDANGKIVETGGGVFGDPTARTESIKKSLETLKDNSIDGLSFSSKMVDLLSNIDVGINGVAKSLFGMQGVRTSGDSLSSTKISSSISVFGSLSTIASSLVSAISPKIAGALFGKTTVTTDVVDAGIALKGSFLSLANNVNGAAQSFQNIITTTKSSGALFGLIGGGTSTNASTVFGKLDSQYTKQIAEVFQYSQALLEELGTTFGKSKSYIDSILSSVDISGFTSLKDLTGQDFVDALSGMINEAIDKATAAIFPAVVDKYKTIGESALQTIVRVVDNYDKVNLAFKAMGHASAMASVDTVANVNLSTQALREASIDVTMNLTKLAGGLSNFISKSNKYISDFLTSSEQLAPIQAEVTKTLRDLGFSAAKTKDDFKYLINNLDLSTSAGQQTYTTLMSLADSFAKVAAAADATDSLRIDLMEAEGKTVEATAARRAKELRQLSATDAAIRARIYTLQDEKKLTDSLNSIKARAYSLQNNTEASKELARQKELAAATSAAEVNALKYVYALEDEVSIRDRAKKAIDTTISSIKSAINSLKDYNSALLLGDKSIGTPQQKYEAAKQEALGVIAAAQATASTVDEVTARNEAISKLPNVTGAWLEASRNLYASSDMYTQDFNTVLKVVQNTSSALDSQLTDTQKQLNILETSGNTLASIDDNTLATSDLLKQFLTAVDATKLAGYSTIIAPASSVYDPSANGGGPAGNGSVTTSVPAAVTASAELLAQLLAFQKAALQQQLDADAARTAATIKAQQDAAAAALAAQQAQQGYASREYWLRSGRPVVRQP